MRSPLGKILGDGRSKRVEVERVRQDVRWLVDRGDLEGLRLYLIALGLEEGTPEHREAIESLRQLLSGHG